MSRPTPLSRRRRDLRRLKTLTLFASLTLLGCLWTWQRPCEVDRLELRALGINGIKRPYLERAPVKGAIGSFAAEPEGLGAVEE